MPGLNFPSHGFRFLSGKITGKLFFFAVAALLYPTFAAAQTASPNSATPAACPVQFIHFSPSGVSVRIKNTSGKRIVGIVFNAAFADATEHWKWYHWAFDDTRPICDFGWNKQIRNGDAKTLSWSNADIDFEHGGGGAFVLTSVLFEDGSFGRSPRTTPPANTFGTTITRNRSCVPCLCRFANRTEATLQRQRRGIT